MLSIILLTGRDTAMMSGSVDLDPRQLEWHGVVHEDGLGIRRWPGRDRGGPSSELEGETLGDLIGPVLADCVRNAHKG